MTKHLRIFALVLCLLAITSTSWAANNWAGSNACAVWSLDDSSGLVLTDSIGNNDLTDYNTVGQDLVDYKEGNGCADYERTNDEATYITDANLDAGFPGKNGVAEQDFSICFWVQFESVNVTQATVSKWNTAGDQRSYVVYVDASGNISWYIGYAGNSAIITLATPVTTGIWYHVGVTYVASNNAMKLRVWDDNAGALLDSNATGTSPTDMQASTAPVRAFGHINSDSNYAPDAQADEIVVIVGEALGDADIDKVRAGTYGAAGVTIPIFDHYYRQH